MFEYNLWPQAWPNIYPHIYLGGTLK